MSFKILKSSVRSHENFSTKVSDFAKERQSWLAHMKRVEEDAKNPDIDPVLRHDPMPPPSAHPDIMSCVDEFGRVDFEIEDDDPSDEEIISQLKSEIIGKINEAEIAALEAIEPAAKRRLFRMREAEISAADASISASIHQKDGESAGDFIKRQKDTVENSRTDLEKKFISENDDRSMRIYQVQRKVAQIYHDVEEMTLIQLQVWKMPELL